MFTKSSHCLKARRAGLGSDPQPGEVRRHFSFQGATKELLSVTDTRRIDAEPLRLAQMLDGFGEAESAVLLAAMTCIIIRASDAPMRKVAAEREEPIRVN